MSKHAIQIRVRYKETDQMGVAYYSNYLVWFEVARTEFFRAQGLEYKKLEDESNLFLPVVESYCRYKSPLRYDDLATIETELAQMGASSITFSYEVKVGDKIAAIGRTKHALVNEKGKPVQIPSNIKQSLSI